PGDGAPLRNPAGGFRPQGRPAGIPVRRAPALGRTRTHHRGTDPNGRGPPRQRRKRHPATRPLGRSAGRSNPMTRDLSKNPFQEYRDSDAEYARMLVDHYGDRLRVQRAPNSSRRTTYVFDAESGWTEFEGLVQRALVNDA